jgi:homoserine kinase type II
MAVYTPVSEKDLIAFLESYDIGSLISFKGIEAGVSNTNYHVFTDRGRFILTLFEPHRVHADDIPFFVDYSIHLEKYGIPCPATLVRKDGKMIASLCDRPAVIFSFLEGNSATAATLTPDLCGEAGKSLAQMHMAAATFGQSSANNFGLPRWRDWMSHMGRSMNKISDGLYMSAAAELSWIEENWPDKLPKGAIHADFFPDNVFFRDGYVSGVIDFHFVCTDSFAYDLAIAVNAWSFDAANMFRPERFDAMMAGYESVRPLSEDEKKAFPVLLRASSLRFLLSRCEEMLKWKPGDFMKPHDPMVFAKRVEFFRGRDLNV